jgi:hypothetical protein
MLMHGVCPEDRMDIYDRYLAVKANAKREEHNMRMEIPISYSNLPFQSPIPTMDSAQAKQAEAAADREILKILLDGVCPEDRMDIYDRYHAGKANAKREEHNMRMETERIEVEKEVNVQKTESFQRFIASFGKPNHEPSLGEDGYDDDRYDDDRYDNHRYNDHRYNDHHYEIDEGTNFLLSSLSLSLLLFLILLLLQLLTLLFLSSLLFS